MVKSTLPRFSPTEENSDSAIDQRRAWVEAESGIDLAALHHAGEAEAYRGNIENQFGYVRLPIGIAGPLLLRGEHAK